MSPSKKPLPQRPSPPRAAAKSREKAPRGGKAIWLLLAGAVLIIAGIAGLFLLEPEKPARATSYPIQGVEHIGEGEAHPPYNSNPPTSGWHYASPAPWGIQDKELPDEQLVHNLEHGGIWISYQPSLEAETVGKLRDLVRRYPSKVILTPRAKNDSRLALAAWGRLDTMDAFDEKRIVAFISAFKDQGPEKVPD